MPTLIEVFETPGADAADARGAAMVDASTAADPATRTDVKDVRTCCPRMRTLCSTLYYPRLDRLDGESTRTRLVQAGRNREHASHPRVWNVALSA